MYSKSNALLSSQIDYALYKHQTNTKNRKWPVVHAVLIATIVTVNAWIFLSPSNPSTENSSTYIFSESHFNQEEFESPLLAEYTYVESTKVDYPQKLVEEIPISPIHATNIATTLYYGPPEHFELLPSGTVTEISVKEGDTLGTIFNDLGIGATTLHAVLQQDLAGAELQKIYPGQKLTFVTDDEGLKQIRYPHSASETFVINKNAEAISVELIERPREVRKNYATATINDSLYMAAQDAHIDTEIVMELAEIFAYDIDFYLDVKSGDTFKVMYEEYYVDGEKVGNGPILAAEFVNQNKDYKIVRYEDKENRVQYYTPDGLSLRKAFLRSPVEYARISSHFNLARRHPILHQIRAHKGVDYAAPRGTPIRASGDGKIVKRGWSGGYGNVIEIQHGDQYRTLYAHMNNFANGLSVGSKVEQGQIIGYVGSTGLASGPHLHYEFKVNGIQKDPVKLDLPMADPLPAAEKKTFMLHASNMFDELNYYDQILLAEATKPKSREHG